MLLVPVGVRVGRAVGTFRSDLVEHAQDPFRGLYISEGDVDEILASVVAAGDAVDPVVDAPGLAGRLRRLTSLFELSSFDYEAFLICLAPDLDLRYERLYAYLQDDATRRRPTVDLVLRLLENRSFEARLALGAQGRLSRRGLIGTPSDEPATSLMARPLSVDDRVVQYVLGSDIVDPGLAPFVQLVSGVGLPEVPSFLADCPSTLVPWLQDGYARVGPMPLVYLSGPTDAGKQLVAGAACAAAGRPLLLVDVPALLNGGSPSSQWPPWSAVIREALLQDALLCLDGFDRLLAEDGQTPLVRAALRLALQDAPRPTLLLGETRWEPGSWTDNALRIELPPLSHGTRTALWAYALNGCFPAEAPADMASRYRLADLSAAHAVAAAARGRAAVRGGEPELDDLLSAAQTVVAPAAGGLARRVEARHDWDDLVLPSDALSLLKELCARTRYQATVLDTWGYGRKQAARRGVTALFAGSPGTGKTLAAEIIGADLALELYRVDLSSVVSKYVGETEKNLERIFQAAEQGEVVLLFDEADALFGKRSEVRDAHDRYANVEVAYLLQRLETYAGLAILTTNLSGNLDEAFMRRLDCAVDFPFPEEPERLAIWRRSLPPAAPLAEDVDLPFLARQFRLAGGHIRNTALTAAFLAAPEAGPIGMTHLLRAIRREYQKLGKLLTEADTGPYATLLRGS